MTPLDRLDDETWLRREYVERGRTRQDIADELGVGHATLDRRRR